MLQKLRGNSQGFTLIELMIVIAIIGILAAIAIPNFIAYRNKSFCTRAESDANGISSSIADYFAIPSHVATPSLSELNNNQSYSMSGKGTTKNVGLIQGNDPSLNITITVTDASSRCPDEYQTALPYQSTTPREDGWVGTTNVFIKYIAP